MDDLDSILNRLADTPAHPRLAGMERRVADRIAAERQSRDLSPSTALAMVAVALGIGVVSGQATVASAAPAVVALGPGLDLAPSSRLGEAG